MEDLNKPPKIFGMAYHDNQFHNPSSVLSIHMHDDHPMTDEGKMAPTPFSLVLSYPNGDRGNLKFKTSEARVEFLKALDVAAREAAGIKSGPESRIGGR